MKILLLDEIPTDLIATLLADNVIYRPDLLKKSDSIILGVIHASGVRAVISRLRIPSLISREWRGASKLVWIQVALDEHPASDRLDDIENLEVIRIAGGDLGSAYISGFQILEERDHEREHSFCPTAHLIKDSSCAKSLVVVGAGLVNLITTHKLAQEGYEIEVLDGGPDPRSSAPWTAFGCSRGGDDARMFTLSEMDNYNDKTSSSDMNSLFNRSVTDSGWNVYRSELGAIEREWIREFESIPTWLAERYNRDIFVYNRESLSEWDFWIKKDPDLFVESYHREGILRIYSDARHFEYAVARQNRIGATRRVLSPAQVAEHSPGLMQAVISGHIAGGILVVGFTVNAHKFIRLLLDRLEALNVRFNWHTKADELVFDDAGKVAGIKTGRSTWKASNYVISPGSYAGRLLEGTKSYSKIHGVLGAWLRIPNVSPALELSLKLARKNHITEDANVTVAVDTDNKPILIIGSGYGHTGIDPKNIDMKALYQVYAGLIDTAEKYFPEAYEAARSAGNLESSLKYCVRPWTATGLGIFEIIPEQSGGACIVTGGHNTGGFAQAPSIANAVFAALEHRKHPMHFHYRPDRASSFLESRRISELNSLPPKRSEERREFSPPKPQRLTA